jgi:hypothetical protein
VRALWVNRVIRLVSLVVFAVGVGLAVHRLRRTPEQQELTRYVRLEVPSLLAAEQPIQERLARLNRVPGLSPTQARSLLVDDVIPRLIQLRRQAEAQQARTFDTRRLHEEYLGVTDQLIDACRACIRVIDDPQLPDGAGLVLVRERFADVRRAYQAWDEHVRQACVLHRLAPPAARP